MKPRIYIAGKIGKNDWRHHLIPKLREHIWGDGPLNIPDAYYVGPFFVSCDHGCFHGPNRHGMQEQDGCTEGSYERQQVIDLNMAAMHNADLIFAYITSADCYGTLYEIGWAVRDGKRVAVAFAPEIDPSDFWFSTMQVAATYSRITPKELPALLRSEIHKTQTTLSLAAVGRLAIQ